MKKILRLTWCFPVLMMAAVLSAAPLEVSATGKMITASGSPITFTLGRAVIPTAKTRVLTIQGEQVAELDAHSLSRFSWDGKDVDQQDVANGFYVVQIEQNGSFWHGPVIVKR